MIDNCNASEGALRPQRVEIAYPNNASRSMPGAERAKQADKAFWLLMSMTVLLGATGLLALLVVFLVNGFGPPPPDPIGDGLPSPLVVVAPEGIVMASPTTAVVVTAAVVPTETPTPAPPVSPTPCVNDAVFVADVTLPDGTEVTPGSRIDKTWRLRNTGTCSWREGYRFKFVSGDPLGLLDSIPVVFTDPGETTDVAIPMFTPKAAGEYSNVWQMADPQGATFGQPVVMKVVVEASATVTPGPKATDSAKAAQDTNEPTIRFWVEDESIRAGQKTRLHVETANVAAVWLDGEIVVGGNQVLEISPCMSTTYTLDVQMRTGDHVYQNVAVEVSGTCGSDIYPDLTIDFSVAPLPVRMGQPAVVSYTVMNLGDETAKGFDVVFRPGQFAPEPVKVRSALELAPGYALQAVYTYTWPVSGVHEALIRVDAANAAGESNEDNNTATHMILVEG